MSRVRVGIIDSGAAVELLQSLRLAQRFTLNTDHSVQREDLQPDTLGHGSAVSRIVHRYAPGAELLVAQVFDATGHTSARQIAAALDWLREARAHIACLSLGVRTDHPCLDRAIAQAQASAMLLCASAPARGAPVYPAAYPGVLRVTGDARCAAHEWSWLGTTQADFGAAVRQHAEQPAGASMANAALCGHLAALWQQHPLAAAAQLPALLRQQAPIQGRQTPPLPGVRP